MAETITASTETHNNHIYKVSKKKINSTLSKIGIPYFGSDEPISIDIPKNHLKLENPVQFKVNQALKKRINELEQTIKELKSKSFSNESKLPLQSNNTDVKKVPTQFDEIMKLMDGRDYFETD
ncbi:hypothetical protein HK100_006680 [Physocladia obscura]|uniref:Uncharacterized protein n=1 Tax=Physocladia obscura TaxID=109957 RepID=A0AAD5SSU5_9FUNG|nr:hypothetical protein HK100_006680 [Physocladia obscura]